MIFCNFSSSLRMRTRSKLRREIAIFTYLQRWPVDLFAEQSEIGRNSQSKLKIASLVTYWMRVDGRKITFRIPFLWICLFRQSRPLGWLVGLEQVFVVHVIVWISKGCELSLRINSCFPLFRIVVLDTFFIVIKETISSHVCLRLSYPYFHVSRILSIVCIGIEIACRLVPNYTAFFRFPLDFSLANAGFNYPTCFMVFRSVHCLRDWSFLHNILQTIF